MENIDLEQQIKSQVESQFFSTEIEKIKQVEDLPPIKDNINMSVAIDMINGEPQTHISIRANAVGLNSDSARTTLIDTRFTKLEPNDSQIIEKLHHFLQTLLKLKNL